MKKKNFIMILLLLFMFFPLVKTKANVCTYDKISSFGGATSNSTVSGTTCPNWSYGKVYGFREDDMLVFCYPGYSTDNNPMFFFDLYVNDNNQCKKYMSAGYWKGKSRNDSNWEGWLSWSKLKIQTVFGTECPKYMYQKKDEFGQNSFSIFLTDDVNDYEKNRDKSKNFWGQSATGGGTVEDIISEDKVITCVSNYIKNNKLCENGATSESNINEKIKTATKECVNEAQQSYGIALDQAALDRFSNNVSNKIIQSETPKLVLECQLMTKCSDLSSLRSSNPTLEQAAIISIYNKTATVEKLITAGVPSELAKCLMKNEEVALQQTQETVGEVTGTVGETVQTWGTSAAGKIPTNPKLDLDDTPKSCSEILRGNLTKIVKASILIFQIVAAIIAIIKGMITLIPAITAKDTDGLKKAEKQLVVMGIILLVIFLLKPIIVFIGKLFDYDLTCI